MPFDKTSAKILIGFDFGMKRIGVAVGQTVTKTARPLDTIQAKAGAPNWNAVQKLINKWLPDALVVGIPYNMDGSSQFTTEGALAFAQALRDRFKVPVYEI